MNWASAGGAAGKARKKERASTLHVRRRVLVIGRTFLLEENAGPADLLGRDDPEEVGQEAVHELEVRGEGRDLLLLSVEDFLGELLLVQGLPGAAVHEVEVRVQAEAFPLGVAVAPHELVPPARGGPHHPFLRLEARAVLDVEAELAGHDEGLLILFADLPPELRVLEEAVRLQLVLVPFRLAVLAR